jgi:hypothetical protein
MQIVNSPCRIHPHQFCNVTVTSTVTDENEEMVHVPSFCVKQFDMKKDMMAHVYSYLASKYTLRVFGRTVKVHTVQDTEKLLLNWYRDYLTPPSRIRLNAMTSHTNNPQLTNVRLATFVPELSRRVDRVISTYVGHLPNLPIAPVKQVKSLQELCKPRTSVYTILNETVTVNGREYPLFYYSTNSYGEDSLKLINLMREFSFDTAQRGSMYSRIRSFVSPALKNLEMFLETDEYVGRFKFHYSPEVLHTFVKFRTSGGIMDYPSLSYVHDGIKYRMMNSGNKLYLFEAALREVHRIIISMAKGNPFIFQPYNITKLKAEIRFLFEKEFEKMPKAIYRMREFFIPSLTLTLMCQLLNGDRMLIERGHVMQIGCTPWYGGWYQLAVIMNYDNPDLFWVDGDISKLDKCITDWQLYIYLAAGARYYAWDKMDRAQRRLLRKLYELIMYHVVNKITLQPGTIWVLILGVMYSGGKETSHGDSWIMGFIFFLYIEYIKGIYPGLAPFIQQSLIARFIMIIIYGDDHVWCCPKVLRQAINATSFASFLKTYLGMELRDYKEYDKFLSEVDIATGVFRYRGPKFLKRFFIDSFIPGSAPVLPYKPYLETSVRLCAVTEEEGYPGLMLKSLGLRWDSMGTNPVTSAACLTAYNFAVERCKKTPREIFEEWKTDPNKEKILRNLVKKVNMTSEQFFDSYPTDEMLMGRHQFQPELCNNRPVIFSMHDLVY